MRITREINNGWYYADNYSEEYLTNQDLSNFTKVNLPHTNCEVPFNYFDERIYQFVSCYKKELEMEAEWEGKKIFVLFEGVMACAEVFINGVFIGGHKGGYTQFSFEIGKHINFGGKNIMTVVVDSTERKDIPPFGGNIDYLTFGGIYREVSLVVVEDNFIKNVFIKTKKVLEDKKGLEIEIELENTPVTETAFEIKLKKENSTAAVFKAVSNQKKTVINLDNLEGIELWDTERPVIYNMEIAAGIDSLYSDSVTEKFGFREAQFRNDGFYLNGRRIKLLGLNRHQSFPYLGYAMPKRGQRRDADILKEYGVNMVRTSHYPQSKHFLDRCDENGLLVFEEIPGWQFIGGEEWQQQVLRDVGDMIIRDRNRPSIVMWGVRINESQDNHELYTKTNKLAKEFDPTRQTGGVRFLTNSELLEDVYTMNDFIHDGGVKDFLRENVKNFATYDDMPGIDGAKTALRTQRQVTGKEDSVPYLVTEFNGHMFPTKKNDSEERLVEHAVRHTKVLNAMYGDDAISGAIGWCAFDYNTHKDFGSGDKICYHGVMDMFRLPKYAANVYKSQKSPEIAPVLEPATLWSRGERCISGVMPLTVFTNCDYIKVYYGAKLFGVFEPDREKYPHLPHPPVVVSEALGFWGSDWEDAKFEGYVDNKKVCEKKYSNNSVPWNILVNADDHELLSGEIDITRVVVKACDSYGNPMMFTHEVAKIEIEGEGELVGPDMIPLYGGTAAFWVKTNGNKGTIIVKVKTHRLAQETVMIDVH